MSEVTPEKKESFLGIVTDAVKDTLVDHGERFFEDEITSETDFGKEALRLLAKLSWDMAWADDDADRERVQASKEHVFSAVKLKLAEKGLKLRHAAHDAFQDTLTAVLQAVGKALRAVLVGALG